MINAVSSPGRMFRDYYRLDAARRFVADAYAGSDRIKSPENAFFYLPPSEREFREEGEAKENPERRTRYRTRLAYGVYENFFRSIIDDIVGIMQINAPTVNFEAGKDFNKGPKELLDLYYWGNAQNDGFAGLKQRVNFGQTLFGRYGLALDVTADAEGLNPRFVVSEYPAGAILDGEAVRDLSGKSTLRWVLTDESYWRFDPKSKTRTEIERFRVFALDGSGRYYQAVFDGDASAKWSEFNLDDPAQSNCDFLVYPSFKGRGLNFVPFSVCNVDRIGVDVWQTPPYWDVARVAVANYQIDSLYKTALWNFASPTLVVKNAESEGKPLYLGDAIYLHSAGGAESADAALLETSGSGLAEIRQAKTEVKSGLRFSSIRDLFEGSGANASAKALALRANSGTATVASIDKTGARALEEILCFAASWLGWSNDAIGQGVRYDANVSYLAEDFQLQSIVSLLQANGATGSPLLSRRQLYRLIGAASGDLLDSFDDNERQLLDEVVV